MKYVNAPVMKKDAMALVTGKPVYMDDVAPKDCLIVKVLRSPYPLYRVFNGMYRTYRCAVQCNGICGG